ncbi:MAG: hypothetical protein ACE14V_04565 [bacterium]
MEIKNYIFLTAEEYAYHPYPEVIESDKYNLLVIGFAKGRNSEEAFNNLKKDDPYLSETLFTETFSIELSKDYEASKKYHFL